MKKLKRIGKLLIVFLLVFLLTGCTKQLVAEKTDKNGKKTEEVVKYEKGDNATGQALTKNILCRPENEELVSLYKENGVKIIKLTKCSNFIPSLNGKEGYGIISL